MSKPKRCVVFYHHDEDGRAAAAIVKLCVKSRASEFVFMEMTYATEPPFGDLKCSDEVYVVDFSFKEKDWNRLISMLLMAPVWIDHHGTAIKAAKGTKVETLSGKREEGKKSGCLLTWEWFFPDAAPPPAIEMISDRDTWTWDHGAHSAKFHAGLQAEDTSPESPIWADLLVPGDCGVTGGFTMIMSSGAAILRFKKYFYEKVRHQAAFETVFEGHRALAINVAGMGSEAFGFPGGWKGEMPDEWPLLIAFYFDGSAFTVSLYSKTINVSVLAKKHGGGGHPGAAGFITHELPVRKGR